MLAAVLSWIRLGLEWQALGFTALSAVLVLSSKKITAKWSRQKYRSTVDALEGQVGYVTADITPGGFGQIKVGGDIWSASSPEEMVIPAGAKVKVIQVDGAHLIVKSFELQE